MTEPENQYGIAWCNLCKPPMAIPVEEAWTHLRVEHYFGEELQTWPDGEAVVVDTTLEPGDFG